MPVTYTNRKGFTYFLCRGHTKTGKPRYYFARDTQDDPLEQTPDGYEIEESVNGVVSLVKARPQLILPVEIAAVESALKKHPKSHNYRLAVKPDRIIIYEGIGPDADEISGLLGVEFPKTTGLAARLQADWERYTQFAQLLQFILKDAERRIFVAQRWCSRGGIGDWIFTGHSGKIASLAKKLAPKLGANVPD